MQKTKERLHQGPRQLLNVAQTTDSCGPVVQSFALISRVFLMFSVSYFLFHDSFLTSSATFWRYSSRILAVFTSRPTSPSTHTRLVLIPQ